MGELPAVAAGACITLEFVVASSAVARSWGDKVVAFIVTYHSRGGNGGDDGTSTKIISMLEPGHNVNPVAFVISTSAVALLLLGVKESKRVTNFFTVLKVALIAGMSIVSISLVQKENLFPLLPAHFGIAGILRGTSSSFFGYIGFDEICCLGGEVVNPGKNLPRAVMGTISFVTVLYVVAALGLVGMVPYNKISVSSGFPDGFHYRGYDILAQIAALGEIVSLPIVVLVTLMAQPRLQYAMAQDGLLPPIFSKVDETGNLWHGTLIAGIFMIGIATFVPFTYLNDLISAGILTAFSMTAASVILLRRESPKSNPLFLEKSLIKFSIMSVIMGILMQHGTSYLMGQLLPVIILLMLLGLSVIIGTSCPEISGSFDPNSFQTPCVPYLPLVAIFLNGFLTGQLGPLCIILLVGYIGTALSLCSLYKRSTKSLSSIDSSGSLHQISIASMFEDKI